MSVGEKRAQTRAIIWPFYTHVTLLRVRRKFLILATDDLQLEASKRCLLCKHPRAIVTKRLRREGNKILGIATNDKMRGGRAKAVLIGVKTA